jgi:hypothetical protein
MSDLVALWGDLRQRRGAARWQDRRPRSRRRPARCAAPAAAPRPRADLALRLLLRHSDWWDRLSSRRPPTAARTGRPARRVVAWLEQQITEHGDLTWAALDEAMQGQAGRPGAPWADPAPTKTVHWRPAARGAPPVVPRLRDELSAADCQSAAPTANTWTAVAALNEAHPLPQAGRARAGEARVTRCPGATV